MVQCIRYLCPERRTDQRYDVQQVLDKCAQLGEGRDVRLLNRISSPDSLRAHTLLTGRLKHPGHIVPDEIRLEGSKQQVGGLDELTLSALVSLLFQLPRLTGHAPLPPLLASLGVAATLAVETAEHCQ